MEKMRIGITGGIRASGTIKPTSSLTVSNGQYITSSGNSYYGNILSYSESTVINQNNMQQVKVGVFKVTRSEETQKVIGTQLLKEMWVEVKPNTDLKLVVASKLTKEDLQGADLSELDIRELTTVSFY